MQFAQKGFLQRKPRLFRLTLPFYQWVASPVMGLDGHVYGK
jgi:hypothetical protein